MVSSHSLHSVKHRGEFIFCLSGVSFFTFGTLKSVGLSYAPTLLGRPSSDNPNVLVLKTHINLLCGGVAGAIAQTIS